MKVLAINGSPHCEKGNTALILGPFLEGMRQAGAEVDLAYSWKMKVNPCGSDWSCLARTAGRCIHDDDMRDLYPKLREADILVIAAPVYASGMPSSLKSVVDRMVPLSQPFIELNDGHCFHPLVEGAKGGKVVLVANCGFWELDNFDPMVAQVKGMSRSMGREYAGALLRPHGSSFAMMLRMGAPVGGVLDAAREAGRQLVETGDMSAELQLAVSRPVIPLEEFVRGNNDALRQMLVASTR
ncbi:MAG TPA: flavodoxin family protein [Chloroflexota bacterium]|nr:flavodoxin family protein [Chloroflexota bacterium]